MLGMGKNAVGDPWRALLFEARTGATLAGSPLHGEEHWRAVAAVGLELQRLCPTVSRPLLLAFGMLHDCRREDEGWDPEHGQRAANVAMQSQPLRHILSPREIDLLAKACLLHEKGQVERDIHDIGLCWDSDRYNLLRLEITPIRNLLSAPIDELQHEAIIERADAIWRDPPSWDSLMIRASVDINPHEEVASGPVW